MTLLVLQAIAFVLFLVALPLLSFGTVEDTEPLWMVGLGLILIAGLIPPILRYAPIGDDDDEEEDEEEADGDEKADKEKDDEADDDRERESPVPPARTGLGPTPAPIGTDGSRLDEQREHADQAHDDPQDRDDDAR
jgi:hypothetical protein